MWNEFKDIDVERLSSEEGEAIFDRLLAACRDASKYYVHAKDSKDEDRNEIALWNRTAARYVDEVPEEEESRFGRSPKIQALMDSIAEMKSDEKGAFC